MASFQQVYYCPKCKTNVTTDKSKHCKKCGNTQLSMKWSIRFRFINQEGKEVQKRLSGFSTKRECQEEYEKFIANAKKFEKKGNQLLDLKFSQLYDEFLEFEKKRIKESSYFALTNKCNLHILPYFKDFLVKDISSKDILNWQNSIDKYSYKHKSNIRTYLSSILNYADKYYKIPNQLKFVDSFRRGQSKKEMLVWSPEEFINFIDNVNDFKYKVFFYSLFYTGTRKGEMLATTWRDWDIDKKILNIDKTLTTKTFNNKYQITLPKNNSSIRQLSIPDILINMIIEYKKQFYESNEDDLVFKLSETSIDRHKKNACKLAKVKEIRIHDFRHTHASFLISQGVSIVAVAKRLGHSNIEQTLNTYSHLMKSEDIKTVEALNTAFKNLGTNLGTK